MRFNVDRTRILKGTWRPWFAWYPVHIRTTNAKDINGHQSWTDLYVWLEWIEHNGFSVRRNYRLPEEL